MVKPSGQRDFTKISSVKEVPYLLDLQTESFQDFLQKDIPPQERKNIGLQGLLNEVFPLQSTTKKVSLTFEGYTLGAPRYSISEVLRRGITYSVPIKLKLKFLTYKKRASKTKPSQVHDIIEEEVYLGDLPLMTDKGTFIINGVERVVTSQLHRSPGVIFESQGSKKGKELFAARIIPDQGVWIELQVDYNNLLYILIGRRRRMLFTVFLKAMGYIKDEDIIKLFYEVEEISLTGQNASRKLMGRILAEDLIDKKSGQKIAESKAEISLSLFKILSTSGHIEKVKVVKTQEEELIILNTLERDYCRTEQEALAEIYSRIRPGSPFELDTARNYFQRLIFSPEQFDLGKIGRHQLNQRLELKKSLNKNTLEADDIVAIVKRLIKLQLGKVEVDDIDHLGKRRVRTVGELLENQLRTALHHLSRSVQEKILMGNLDELMPHNLVNPRLVNNSLMEFFGQGELSQFMDETNPLAELTHKRRLSALGPEGLTRERAGIEVRDVHPTHYGRICPVETPEGQNIGLITSLASYGRVNNLGLLETPYRKVVKGKVTKEVEYLSADQEDKYIMAQANVSVDKEGRILDKEVLARFRGDFRFVSPEKMHYIDIDPIQTVSVSTSLIPFLEHDDSNRALMGSNMQRQAVTLIMPEAPIVQTGMERKVAQDSGATILAERDGIVEKVSGVNIIVRVPSSQTLLAEFDYYPLQKFKRSNQSTCVNQRPVVREGQKVKKGDILADGPAIKDGKLALGRNLLVAFMPWEGYNFEDAILISGKVAREDIYTSIHIEEFEVECRETKLGKEEITRDIPNVAEESLRNLDEMGVVRIGAYVKSGDIIVGKITPKGETVLTSEEKLLRAIFGEKAGEVLNTSLVLPIGVEGTVIDTRVFSLEEEDKNRRKKNSPDIVAIKRKYSGLLKSLEEEKGREIKQRLIGQTVKKEVKVGRKSLFASGEKIKEDKLKDLEGKILEKVSLREEKINQRIGNIIEEFKERKTWLKKKGDKEIKNYLQVEELSAGVIKMVKVYIATKRKLSEGDKLSGRHGNKGVVAKILPEEQMPYLPDGTPVEIVLNPLGVPSRMNLGQILETHLGWAARTLGLEIISPVFNGAREEEVKECLREAGLSEDGKTILLDGRTGEPFKQRITVGYIYMMKLNHLVEDKIHARSTGPYSLITQQPLGGKAQMGGQRFGEMEVWALEAYGAAHILQETLTVKSDDIEGRTRIYESIVKGENTLVSGTPESFNVLAKELQGLCLNVRIERTKTSTVEDSSWEWLRKDKDITTEISSLVLGLASPQMIKSWSRGEVKKPETINYRTFKAEKDGLFCEKIFGPTKDWECYCGKYKKIKHKGVVCDRCGVEVTESKIRRERMGHIGLVTPVTHIWFFKVIPSVLGTLLNMTLPNLEKVIYYDSWIVLDPGKTPLNKKQVLADSEVGEYREKYGDSFQVGMGAGAIRTLLQELDLDKLENELQKKERSTSSKQSRRKISKWLKLVEAFRTSDNRPEWMILDAIPVIPPNLRPLVPLKKGGFATSDLNDLYRRVINRNNRLKRLIELGAPEIILRNEKRMLQEAVDAVFDNGRRGKVVVGKNGRPLKSLADALGGKQGRFRQNLLGKRVDYSGRSVIVVDPKLKLDECGIPKKMALELFQPFIIRDLKEKGFVHTIRAGKKMIEQGAPEVWSILENVIQNHLVFLNRAPTLHRLGVQAFRPKLTEEKAIRIHPLVCSAFNADFDGDTMSVYVPLSLESLMESKLLMLSTNNLFKPSDGTPVVAPTQDIVLGINYLTKMEKTAPSAESEDGKVYSDINEVEKAYQAGYLSLHSPLWVRLNGEKIKTSAGRIFFNMIFPQSLSFQNEEMDRSKLSNLVSECIQKVSKERAITFLDKLKELGFHYATVGGISIGIDDVKVPPQKQERIAASRREAEKIDSQYHQGIITYGERYNRLVDLWTRISDEIADNMFTELESEPFNPILLMMKSKARGSAQQIRQLGGMRGLIARPRKELVGAIGEIIETPITTNFREGLSVLEYFISTHGGRKGLADTALKTSQAGYLTRRLVDAAQDVIVTEEDCGTVNGIKVKALEVGGRELSNLRERIVGRVTLEDIEIPVLGNPIVKAGEEIAEDAADIIVESGLEEVFIRSVLTCESREGICQKCYGRDLASRNIVEQGHAVGIMAAQAIGEPGTQLTLRTFHIGGTASRIVGESQYRTSKAGIVKFENLNTVQKEGELVALNRNGEIKLLDEEGNQIESFAISVGASVKVEDGQQMEAGKVIASWDAYTRPFLSEIKGRVEFKDIIKGITMREDLNRETKLYEKTIIEHRVALHPQIIVRNEEKEEVRYYFLPTNTHIVAKEGQEVTPGALLAKTPREVIKATDITGGLPRVAELFEARKPKNPAVVAEVDGWVKDIVLEKNIREMTIEGEGEVKKYSIPYGKHIEVDMGDWVKAGQKLTDGPVVIQEMLRIEGERRLQQYLVDEIQEVYRLQGVKINDKHIELIVRQMLKRVKVEDPGDTSFMWEEQVDKVEFQKVNEEVVSKGGNPAKARPLVMGITKASLSSSSFVSAASFQETSRVLTRAAVFSKKDTLKGLKENVIIGKLIPAGTGRREYREMEMVKNAYT